MVQLVISFSFQKKFYVVEDTLEIKSSSCKHETANKQWPEPKKKWIEYLSTIQMNVWLDKHRQTENKKKLE